MWSLSLITAPAAEPLTSDDQQTKAHLRLDEDLSPQDPLLDGAIQTARRNCETFTGRQLITATWELWLSHWGEEGLQWEHVLWLPRPPLQPQAGPVDTPTAGVLSVTYLDINGVRQTWDASLYEIIAPQGPQASKGGIFPAYRETWPTALCRPDSIKVKFTAGYGADGDAVPAGLRQGMLLEVGEMYERRELATIGTIQSINQLTAERLWWPFRAF